MRTCTRCGSEKPETEYSLKNGKPETRCKRCKADASAAWRLANPGRMEQASSDWHARNPDRKRETNRIWAERNAIRTKYSRAKAMSKWQKKNSHKTAALAAARRAYRGQATPVWADREKIGEFYFAANFLSMVTGEWHHVDHIVPPKSKFVCGLHNEFNLRVITATENMQKGNRTWPGKA